MYKATPKWTLVFHPHLHAKYFRGRVDRKLKCSSEWPNVSVACRSKVHVGVHTYTNSFIPAKCNTYTGIELQWTLTCIQVDHSLFEFRFIEE